MQRVNFLGISFDWFIFLLFILLNFDYKSFLFGLINLIAETYLVTW